MIEVDICDAKKVPPIRPWRIILASELSFSSDPFELFSINGKEDFDQLFSQINPSVSLCVPNILSTARKHLDVSLKIRSLKDFSPQAVIDATPSLAQLYKLRNRVIEACAGVIEIEQLRSEISSLSVPAVLSTLLENLFDSNCKAPVAKVEEASSACQIAAVDKILSMVDSSIQKDTPELPNDTETVTMLGKAVCSGTTAKVVKQREATAVIGAIDRLLSGQLEEIIHAADFLALEKAWRELKLLVDRIDFRSNVKLDVLCCKKENLREALFERVFRPVWKEAKIAPDLIICAHPFNRALVDIEIIDDLAELGQNTQTPFVLWASESFFELNDFADVNSATPSIANLLNGAGYIHWRAFREKQKSDWIIMTTNSFCLRETYVSKKTDISTFCYEEGGRSRYRPWGAASVAVGCIFAETIAMFGTEKIMTLPSKAELTNLPTMPLSSIKGKKILTACRDIWNDDMLWDLAQAGIMGLACKANSDSLYPAYLSTMRKNGSSAVVVMLAGYLSRNAVGIAESSRSLNDEEIAALIATGLCKIITGKYEVFNKQAIKIAIYKSSDPRDRRLFEVKISLPYRIYSEEVTIDFSFEI